MDNQKTTQIEEEIRLYAPGGAPRIVAIGGGHGLSTMLRGQYHPLNPLPGVLFVIENGALSKHRGAVLKLCLEMDIFFCHRQYPARNRQNLAHLTHRLGKAAANAVQRRQE